jgi:uncharacterized protein
VVTVKLYLDTSVVVALFVEEQKSPAVRVFLREQRAYLVTSDFMMLELASTMSRKVRERVLSPVSARTALSLADAWVHQESEHVLLRSGDLFAARGMLSVDSQLGLRAPDALHISIALRTRAALATHDRKLAVIAPEFGVTAL